MADLDDSTARNGTAPEALESSVAAASPDLGELIAAAAAPGGTGASSASSSASDDGSGDDATVEGAAAGSAATAVSDEIDAAAGAPDVTPGFLSELTDAMMVVVSKERDRVGAIVDADAETHLAQAKERAASEAEAFRQVADEDVASIEAWADAEVERVRADAERRIVDRKADLDAYLTQHDAVLQSELEAIDKSVADYRLTLQSFLDDLQATGDPFEIADRARSLPRPPALDDVRAVARADALTKIAEQSMAADSATSANVEEATTSGVPASAEATEADADGTVAVPVDASGGDGRGAPAWYGGGGGVATDADASTTAIAPEPSTAGAEEAVTPPAESGEAEPTVAASTTIDAWAGSTPSGGGSDASAQGTGWESEHDLAGLIGSTPTAIATEERPVAVMDPDATASTGWESSEMPAAPTAVGTAEESGFGHPNAAVRLIRSVAPWTAPTRDRDQPHTD